MMTTTRRTTRALPRGLPLLLAALALLPTTARAQDALVDGCNELSPGEVGIRELVGDVGDTVAVAVTVHTTGPLETVQLEIEFPETLLAYRGTESGALTVDFPFFRGNLVGGRVRVLGFANETPPIPADTRGTIARVRFEVLAAGAGAFVLPEELFAGGLGPYAACDSTLASAVEPATWGRTKAGYRESVSPARGPGGGSTSRNTTP